MYHPTTRVLTVLELLQSHGRLSGPDLAARLEVDGRTVRRYITMLQDMGIPIEAERGRHGAYRLRPGFKLPPLMFTEDEAVALTLGLLAARELGLAGAAPAVEGALAKVERVLPAALRERARAVQETVTLAVTPSAAIPAGDVVATLSTAVRQGRRVRLRYRSWRDEETERALDPYGLVYRRGRWFAVGHCHLRAAVRVFRLDRIRDAALGDETFTPPPGFDSLDYVLRSLATAPARWEVDVLLHATLEEARCRVSPDIAALDEEPGGVRLTCAVGDLPWIARILAGLGCPFVVRRPPELRAALRQLAADLARSAES